MSREVLPWSPELRCAVEPIWSELAHTTGEWSPFLARSWVAAWLTVYGPTLEPEALVWRDASGAPVGCALVTVADSKLGPFTIRRAYVNATGGTPVLSEHNDLLVRPEHRDRVVADLVDHVIASQADTLSLVGFKSEGAAKVLAQWPRFASSWPVDSCASRFVDLAMLRENGQTFLDSVSSGTRAQIRRSVRLYTEAHGPPDVEIAPDAETAVAWLAELESLHTARWTRRGSPGAFTTEESRRFFRLVILEASSDPHELALDVVRVRFGDRAIGYLYNLRRGGHVSFYQSGLAYEADNRLKPGLVVHALAVQRYLDCGIDEYDFLAGEPVVARYKRSLSTSSRDIVWSDVPAPTARMRAVSALRSLRAKTRQIASGVPHLEGEAAG